MSRLGAAEEGFAQKRTALNRVEQGWPDAVVTVMDDGIASAVDKIAGTLRIPRRPTKRERDRAITNARKAEKKMLRRIGDEQA